MKFESYLKFEDRASSLRLDMNENLFPLPPALTRAFREYPEGLVGAYPEYGELKRRISSRYRIPDSRCEITDGADEAISACVAALAGPHAMASAAEEEALPPRTDAGGLVGESAAECSRGGGAPSRAIEARAKAGRGCIVLLPDPAFSVFALRARLSGAEVATVPYSADLALDLEAFAGKAKAIKPQLAVLINPSNPTGTLVTPADIEALAKKIAPCVLLVDETYADFAGVTVLDRVGDNPNLLVLRSFSKSFALAGLRVGWLAAQEGLIEKIGPFLLPFGANAFGVSCAIKALDDPAMPGALVEPSVKMRGELARGLSGRFGRVSESRANFVLFEAGKRAAELDAFLAARGIRVRRYEAGILAGFLRANAAPEADIASFLSAIDEFQKGVE
jgi:histidinol-phosphate aminotransferase